VAAIAEPDQDSSISFELLYYYFKRFLYYFRKTMDTGFRSKTGEHGHNIYGGIIVIYNRRKIK